MFTIPPVIRATRLFIGGEYVNAVKGGVFSVINPSTEEEICRVQEGTKADIDLAVKAARQAFSFDSKWRTMDASERGRLLYLWSDVLEKDKYYIASVESFDSGKTPESALDDVESSIRTLRYYGGLADKIQGEVIPANGNIMSFTRREPVGVVGGIVPWNYPIDIAMSKIAPALAAGCTIVLKPAEQTPLTALLLGQYCNEAGLPKGVINVISGYGPTAGAALAEHPDVDKISFTGSTEVGKLIMKASGDSNLKRVTLELGGKSPVIVCADCPDLERIAGIIQEAAMVNHGQCCVAGTRTFVEASIYDMFVNKMKQLAEERAKAVGDPLQKGTIQGPQIDRIQMDKVMELIESGKRQGARLVTGGFRIARPGFFVCPTVFADVQDSMRIALEEIFGPVQCILKFHTLEEAISRANDTPYGLGAAIFTGDIDKALTTAQRLQAGTVWINTYLDAPQQVPFGGFKQSGQGREYGLHGVDCYLETKTVTVALSKKIS